jgi:hypothetical protein
VGSLLGNKEGIFDGRTLGEMVGALLGRQEGLKLGVEVVGTPVGKRDGVIEGHPEGRTLGEALDVKMVGVRVGTRDGTGDGACDGDTLGMREGDVVCPVKYAIQMVQEGSSVCSPTAKVNTISPVVWSVSSSTH